MARGSDLIIQKAQEGDILFFVKGALVILVCLTLIQLYMALWFRLLTGAFAPKERLFFVFYGVKKLTKLEETVGLSTFGFTLCGIMGYVFAALIMEEKGIQNIPYVLSGIYIAVIACLAWFGKRHADKVKKLVKLENESK